MLKFFRNMSAIILGPIIFVLAELLAAFIVNLIFSIPFLRIILSGGTDAISYAMSAFFYITFAITAFSIDAISVRNENGFSIAFLIVGIIIVLLVVVLYIFNLLENGFSFSTLLQYGSRIFSGALLIASAKQ